MGQGRLQQAIDATAETHEVSIEWLPYQLMPNCSLEGEPFTYGSFKSYAEFKEWTKTAPRWNYLCSLAKEFGFVYNGKGDGRMPNTILFHTVMKFYADKDALMQPRGCLQNRFQAAAFEEYYTHGAGFHANATNSYLKAAERAGLDTKELTAFLAHPAALDEIQKQVSKEAQLAGRTVTSGIPAFIFNGTPAFSGAQETDAFVRAFQQC